MAAAWRECDGASEGCAASRMWHAACAALCAGAGAGAGAEAAWAQLQADGPPDNIWHSLKNCVAYQAEVWERLLSEGVPDATQPAAFQLAVVLRHAPRDLVVRLLGDLLTAHPQCQDLTSYILALLTEDEAGGAGGAGGGGPAPARDLQLYADLELGVLGAGAARYERHARLVRAEYPHLTPHAYALLRIKILNQFFLIPKLFLTVDFEGLEDAARENIKREILALKESH